MTCNSEYDAVRSQAAHAERCRIIESARILSESERGRDVAHDLRAFLAGRISGLDGRGWSAVLTLMGAYQNGYAGSVLEALEY